MGKLYPSPFEIGERFEFSNKHGRCVLEAVTLPLPVSPMLAENSPEECRITLDQVEQIALITDQVRLHPVVNWMEGATICAYVRYASTSEAGWVRVVSLEYTNAMPATEQIEEDMRRGRNSHLLFIS